MSSISAPSWLTAIPPGTRLLAGATVALSLALSVSRANQNRTVPGLGAVFGALAELLTMLSYAMLTLDSNRRKRR